MFKKSFMAMMALFLVLFVTGCGGGNKDNAQKAAADKPEFSADQAVLGYAEMYAFGVTEHEKEAGLTEADLQKYGNKIIGETTEAFAEFPLSEDNVATMVGNYVGTLSQAMEMKAEVVKDDPEHPVVKLSAKTLNQKGAEEVAANNEDLLALGTAMGTLQAQGLSLDEMKANEEFQKSAMEVLNKFVSAFPMNPEASIEVTCDKVKGADGKFYWAPQDKAALETFVQPK